LVFPTSSIKSMPGKGLELYLSGISASISANWGYRKKSWPHLSGHGSVDIDISGVTVMVDIAFNDIGGHPGCKVIADNVAVGQFNIKVHGGESWIFNLFIDIFKNKIKDEVSKGMKNGIEKAIDNNLNQKLQSLPLRQTLQNILIADYTLVDAPRFGANYMVLDCKGEFFSVKNQVEAPFTPAQLPDLQGTDVMVQISIAQYVPDTVGFALWKQGILVAHVDDSMIPKESPVRFNTNSFQYVIPPLWTAYPDKMLEATIDPIASPEITFDPGNIIGIRCQLEMIWYVIIGAGNSKQAFTLGIDITGKGKVSLVNHLIMVNITTGNITLSLRNSQIGTFDVSPLNDLAFLVIAEGIPFVNQYLTKGIPLPNLPGVEFINPFLGYGNGFIYVNTNIKYTPSTSISQEPWEEKSC